MATPVHIEFMKLEGCGNSFVITHDLKKSGIDWQAQSIKLCSAHFGIGSDGLLVVVPSQRTDFEVKMFNPDGSRMGMCGNGIRCVSRYLALKGLILTDKHQVNFEVEGRLIVCTLHQQGKTVKVDMGEPSFDPKKIPIASEQPFIHAALQVQDRKFDVTCVSMGNPHCVTFLPALDKINCQEWGPRFEYHEFFPERTNVEFVEVVAKDRLRIKVWERGAGLTLACGTAACAAVVAGVKEGHCNHDCHVDLPGGELRVHLDEKSGRVFLTGPAREICEGRVFS